MFVIDFDDTLFDTQAFKDARCRALVPCGVSPEIFWETYRLARNTPEGLFVYSNNRHAEILAERGFDRQCVIDAFERASGEHLIASFLFEEAKPFLDFLKTFHQPLVLLSLGDTAAQELKVRASGIHNYFDRVFFVDAGKVAVMRELMGAVHDSDVWFINDKVGETKEIADFFPGIRVVLKQAPAFPVSDYAESAFPYFSSLTDIQRHITNAYAGKK